MILDPNGMPILQPAVDNAETATFNTAFAAIGSALAEVIPAGNVSATARASAPDGWLLCDGQAVSRTTYEVLFTAISTTYGAGNGSTTFNVPNLKGRVPVGVDAGQTEFDTLGETGGEKTHTLTENEMPDHDHSLERPQWHYADDLIPGSLFSGYPDYRSDHSESTTSSAGGGGAHNNLQPYIALNYIVKT